MRDALLAQFADQPFARGVGVGERLLRRERLGADDEERGRRIDLLERVREFDAIDVRDAMQADAAVAKPGKRLGHHDDTEIRSADADVDHVGEAGAGETQDAPWCTPVTNSRILSSWARTSGITSRPSACIGRSERLRSAMCMAARPSVL